VCVYAFVACVAYDCVSVVCMYVCAGVWLYVRVLWYDVYTCIHVHAYVCVYVCMCLCAGVVSSGYEDDEKYR